MITADYTPMGSRKSLTSLKMALLPEPPSGSIFSAKPEWLYIFSIFLEFETEAEFVAVTEYYSVGLIGLTWLGSVYNATSGEYLWTHNGGKPSPSMWASGTVQSGNSNRRLAFRGSPSPATPNGQMYAEQIWNSRPVLCEEFVLTWEWQWDVS